MASGYPGETRAYARLPGLDITVFHRGAHGDEGEQVVVGVRAVPSRAALGRPVGLADPFLLWTGLAQATWAFWLGGLAAATTPPWLAESD